MRGLRVVFNLVDLGMCERLGNLARDGFGVLEDTSVTGEYQGCDYGRQIELMNGLIFQCTSYNYHYAYGPEVLILKNVKTGALKVLIDGDEADGTLYRRQ
ncbi:hypothetical protein AJ87_03075 [Rhizobium yanglingense]|nr:hypothetical protein AJ87_03075 [Rhizobium yanglingense]